MPKIVCVSCEVEYRPETNGVLVNETASFATYKLWHADLLKCPKCHNLIIAGFASEPLAEHWQDDFIDIYKEAIRSGQRLYRDNEA